MPSRAFDRGAAQAVRATARGSPGRRNHARNRVLRPSSRLTVGLPEGTNGTAPDRPLSPPLSCEARRRLSPGCGSCSAYPIRDLFSAVRCAAIRRTGHLCPWYLRAHFGCNRPGPRLLTELPGATALACHDRARYTGIARHPPPLPKSTTDEVASERAPVLSRVMVGPGGRA